MLLDWILKPSVNEGIRFFGGSEWTFVSYAELAQEARCVATALRSTGLGQGGCVAISLSDPQEFVVSFFGALYANMTPLPVAPPLPFADLEEYKDRLFRVVKDANASAALVDPEWIDELRSAGIIGAVLDFADVITSEPLRPADGGKPVVALCQLTSGSSGPPRVVHVSWNNLVSNLASIRNWLGIGPGDVGASWLPLYHDMGLVGMLLSSIVGQNDLYLMRPEQFIQNPREWLVCLGKYGATITAAPTFAYGYTARRVDPSTIEDLDTSSVRALVVGAERVDPTSLGSFLNLLTPTGLRAAAFRPAYGLAEATLAVSGVPLEVEASVLYCDLGTMIFGEAVRVKDRSTLGAAAYRSDPGAIVSSGKAFETTSADIVDGSGRPLPEGHLGELVLSGPSITEGSMSSRESEYARTVGRKLFTGDVAFIDREDLYIVGRFGDSIKVAGRRVYAEDLESILVHEAGVRAGRCVVIAGLASAQPTIAVILEDPDPDWANSVAKSLARYLGHGAKLEMFRAGRGTIERTTSGKPRRRVMAEKLLKGVLDIEPISSPSSDTDLRQA